VKELCCNFGMSDATLRRSSSPHDSTVIPVDQACEEPSVIVADAIAIAVILESMFTLFS
jgi:hypothetical protein